MQQPRVPQAHLPLNLAAAYTLLIVYASLYPFSGWHDSGNAPADFLFAPWPRYWTGFDLATNILAYISLGFSWVPALQARHGRGRAMLLTALLACCVSLSMETLQNFLPTRVASNLDLATNSLGGLIGALIGGRWGAELLDGGRLHALSRRLIGDDPMAIGGLVLLTLWLLTQLNPEILLFGNGDLHGILATLGVVDPLPYSAEHFLWVEAGVTASNTVAIGLIASCLLREHRRRIVIGLLVVALLVKSLSLMILASGIDLTWATPGSLIGLGGGLILWLMADFLPRILRHALGALALMLATTLVNLIPENPYLAATLQTWQQGHFLNFNGLTRLASSLWPFLALPWLMLLRLSASEKP